MDTWDPIAKDVKENQVKEKKTGIKYDPAMNRTRGGSRRRNRGGGQINVARSTALCLITKALAQLLVNVVHINVK